MLLNVLFVGVSSNQRMPTAELSVQNGSPT